MKIGVLPGLAFLFCGAAWAADAVQPLNVKLGMWESTVTVEHSGAPPIPDEVLARLTPEQRAKFEERMKAAAQQGAKTNVSKHCVKKEDLDKAMAFGNDDKNCHRTVVTSSSSKLEFKMECAAASVKSSGIVRVEAVSSEHVKGTMQMSVGDGARAMKMNSTFDSKWLGPACEGTK